MRILSHLIIATMAAVVLTACSHSGQQAPVGQPSDSLYTEQAALQTYGKDPARALVIIDSAELLGNVTPFKADFVRATVYGRATNNPDYNRAIELCKSLLERPEASDATEETANMRASVLRVLREAYRIKNDHEQWLKYSVELMELNRKLGLETEMLRTEADIAVAYTNIGREEEGKEMLDRVIATLEKGPLSVDRMDAWIVATKRKINILEEEDRLDEIIPLAEGILSKLEHYEANVSDYANDSFRLPSDPETRKNYCDFYGAQAHAFLSHAYAHIGQLKEARKHLELFDTSEYGQTTSARNMLPPTLRHLGEWDRLLAIDAEEEMRIGTDTTNAIYATILYDRAEAARAKHRYDEAYALLNRYALLQRTLNRQLQKSQAQEYAAKYHEQSQQMALDKEKAQKNRTLTIAYSLTVLFLISLVFIIILIRQMRAIRDKNAALTREIIQLANIQDYYVQASSGEVSSTPDKIEVQQAQLSDMTDTELFYFLHKAIISERLFLNPILDRQQLMDRFRLSKDRIGAAFSKGSHYPSLKAYLNDVRLNYAAKMLIEHLEMPIANVASASGFSSSSIFSRNFKLRFALTPTEFREQKSTLPLTEKVD